MSEPKIEDTDKDCPVCYTNWRLNDSYVGSPVKIKKKTESMYSTSPLEDILGTGDKKQQGEKVTLYCDKCGILFHKLPEY